MKISEIITEHKMVWTRRKTTTRGGKPVLKWRCTTGPRKGRVVPQVSDCNDQIDVAKRERMKKTRARTEKPQARRAQRTKKINTASRLINKLNRFR
jgi:hypothetical protein